MRRTIRILEATAMFAVAFLFAILANTPGWREPIVAVWCSAGCLLAAGGYLFLYSKGE